MIITVNHNSCFLTSHITLLLSVQQLKPEVCEEENVGILVMVIIILRFFMELCELCVSTESLICSIPKI